MEGDGLVLFNIFKVVDSLQYGALHACPTTQEDGGVITALLAEQVIIVVCVDTVEGDCGLAPRQPPPLGGEGCAFLRVEVRCRYAIGGQVAHEVHHRYIGGGWGCVGVVG